MIAINCNSNYLISPIGEVYSRNSGKLIKPQLHGTMYRVGLSKSNVKSYHYIHDLLSDHYGEWASRWYSATICNKKEG